MNVQTHSHVDSQDTPSQEYEQQCDEGLDNDEEGFVSRGRAANLMRIYYDILWIELYMCHFCKVLLVMVGHISQIAQKRSALK